MKIIGIIPARMGSSRFPGKPLADINGWPMIAHVYKRSKLANILNEVYVATCDKEIYDYIVSIDGKAIMTSDQHERASDRTAEALLHIEKNTKESVDIIVMLQGDEPMITPDMIEAAVDPLIKNKKIKISNLYSKINSLEEFEDRNEIKVVIDQNQFALYFSRQPIPFKSKQYEDIPMFKQVCVIPFTREFLLEYNNLKPTKLEEIESVDMLRVLENGIKIKMVYSEQNSYSVDNQYDLNNVIELMKNDQLINNY